MKPRHWIGFTVAAACAWPTIVAAEQQWPAAASAEIAAPPSGAERAGSKPSRFAGRQEFDVTGAAHVPPVDAAAGASPLAASDARETPIGGTGGGGGEGATGGGNMQSESLKP